MTEPRVARTADVPTPRRGRPPRYTREQIVRDVAEALLADPTAPITIARAAEVVGAAPMSLYRHFADREDLLVSVANYVFAAARPPAAPGTTWQDQVRTWMTTVYHQATRVPQLVQLVATGESPAWLADSAYLAATLERAGISDDRRLAEAVHFVATTTLGQAMIRAVRPASFPPEHLERGFDGLSADDAARVRRVLPHLVDMQPTDFENIVAWTIAALEHGITTTPAPGAAARTRPRRR
jgi:TetR/AcrR family transcriptional regulator, tetracycline repressor protein